MIGLLLCTVTTVVVYYLMLSQQQEDDTVYDDIGVSLSTLSLHHDDPHSSNHSNTSWFSELNKLDLLNVDSSQPVAMDTANKQIISPPKLKLRGMFSPQQDGSRIRAAQHSTINHKQYYIIIVLSCLLSASVTCNIMLMIYCMVT